MSSLQIKRIAFTIQQQKRYWALGILLRTGIIKELNGDIEIESELGKRNTLFYHYPLLI